MTEKISDSKIIDEEIYGEFNHLKKRLLKINKETEKALKEIDFICKNNFK